MGYKLVQVELSDELAPIVLAPEQEGCGIVARWQGRLIGFHLQPWPASSTLPAAELRRIADRRFSDAVLAARIGQELGPADLEGSSDRPSVSIAICTKDRPARLARLLESLQSMAPDAHFSAVEIVVVDNASANDATRDAVARFEGVRYVFEPRTGLDFARNAAITAASGDLIAFLDDDVVVDRDWLTGLAEAWTSRPDAGGFTGLVLPFRLETPAQVAFERRGGFRRGVRRLEYRAARHDNPLFPVGAGVLGAGCNMTFDRRLLIELGGFDEALDTGAPLPGGGDLDMFYRVLRSGRAMVYEPRYAVYHEHRETMPQLHRQYWSWGLGMMAFLVKSRRTDPGLRPLHRAMVRWWFGDQIAALVSALRAGNLPDARFALFELWGGIAGLAGEYDRSLARTQAIRVSAR